MKDTDPLERKLEILLVGLLVVALVGVAASSGIVGALAHEQSPTDGPGAVLDAPAQASECIAINPAGKIVPMNDKAAKNQQDNPALLVVCGTPTPVPTP